MNKFKKNPIYLKILSILLLTIILIGVAKLIEKQNPEEGCPNCNVILIGIDTFRVDHLGVYGYTKIQTPNIDSLASQGVLFKANYSQSITTTPSFMSIFTSLYPADHGLLFTPSSIGIPSDLLVSPEPGLVKINDKVTTLTQILNKNGYYTQAFVTSAAVFSDFGFGKGFDNYTGDNSIVQRNNFINWLESYNGGKFFAFFHDITLHSPYDQVKKYASDIVVQKGKIVPGNNDYLNQFNPNNASDMQQLTKDYDKNAKDEDQYIGTLMATLKKKNLLKNTIVIFMSDHGEELGDHGTLSHQEFYNEITHVPLIIYAPQLKKGTVINQTTRSIDVMPTILDLLKVSTNTPMRGISLLPMIKDPLKNLHLPAVSIMSANESILLDNYKYIDQENQQKMLGKPITQELYDLKTDPGEKVNLINKNLPIQQTLMDIYKNILSQKGYFQKAIPLNEPQLEKNVIDRMRSLGY